MKITALIITKDDHLLDGCVEHLKPYVDDFVIVRHGIDFPYTEPVDMGAVRTFGLRQVKTEWFIQVDSDEYYPKESLIKIREAIDNAKDELGFRVPYYNLAWRSGYYEKKLDHFPDRIYRTEAVDKFDGMLPNDMTLIKPRFYKFRPYLEYDNAEDKSFENPVQPIIQAPFYHLARTRGYFWELRKWFLYNCNLRKLDMSNIDWERLTLKNG
jgi:glycosyltransferase involved in cell wall biosynthesis